MLRGWEAARCAVVGGSEGGPGAAREWADQLLEATAR